MDEANFEAMEDFENEREEWFREFLELPNGIPDKDTFRRLFERINPAELKKCLDGWLVEHDRTGREVNIDGKTICGSGKAGDHRVLHVVSVWVNEQNLVLGQITTDEKSNEITAIPQLLDLLDVAGDTVTIDIDAVGSSRKRLQSLITIISVVWRQVPSGLHR